MKTLRTQLILSFGALCVLLTLSTSAQATNNSAQFALTATFANVGSIVENPTGVFTTKLGRAKITNKELLKALGIVYPVALTPGAVLSVDDTGTFVINNQNGVLLQTISDTVLDITAAGGLYRKGVVDGNTSTITYKNLWSPTLVLLNIDSNHDFELYGGLTGNMRSVGSFVRTSYLIQFAGPGLFEGTACYFEGKITLKVKP